MESLARKAGRQGWTVFNNLFEFYRSTEWRKFLSALKLERMNSEGVVPCEYCGKPIVKAYDMIGHHKQELTEENVNDYSISLNPENVGFVHHRCHNYIHNKLGYKHREVFLVYGAPFSGLSEWVKNNASVGDLVVEIDSIWRCVSGCDVEKPNRLKSVVFAVRDTLIDCVRYRRGKWQNAYVVGGFPLSSERERLCRELGAREVYVESTKEECITKLSEAAGYDRKEYEGYIEDWFRRHDGAV